MSKNASDLDLIAQAVQLYFEGMYHSDIEKLKKAFHPNAFLHGYGGGELLHLPLDGWLEHVKTVPAPAENGEAYDMKIVSIDVASTIAVAKVADLYQGLRYTDYLSLVKVEDNWQIVDKIFHAD